MKILEKYFPGLEPAKLDKFSMLYDLYAQWNEQINVISRKDMDNFYERHVLHALSIAKFISFQDNSVILDLGTGGGFPGIPLAIYFPEVEFHLTDSIAKKIKVAEGVAKELHLNNVVCKVSRAEDYMLKCDFVVSRAVAKMSDLVGWSAGKIKTEKRNFISNGIIALKGGDLEDELRPYRKRIQVVELKNYFEEDFFETKKLVYYHA